MDQVSTAGASDNKPGGDPSKGMSGGCFDCNICLDLAVEPVVTRCGHLYCWPCIYEWLRRRGQEERAGVSTGRPCPVCKGPLPLDSLVPLYGRGGSRSDKPRPCPAIPCRPTVHRAAVEQRSAQTSGGSGRQHVSTEQDWLTRSPGQAHHHAGASPFDVIYPPPPLGRGVNVMHSTAGGLLGGMAMAVLPSVFRGQTPATSAYYSSPYHQSAAVQNMSTRLRRHHMELERSLHQLFFFLSVFVVLCLLLF